MKRSVITLVFLFFISFSFSQEEWRPIGLNMAGQNKVDGLEASYQLTTCNGSEVATLKLKNHTSQPMFVEWYPAVFTYDLKWIRKENQDDKIMITLAPNSEVVGDCANPQKGMLVLLKDFSVKLGDVKRYGMHNLIFYNK